MPGKDYFLSGITALTAAEVALTPVVITETPVETTSAVIDTAASPTAKTEQDAIIVLNSTTKI